MMPRSTISAESRLEMEKRKERCEERLAALRKTTLEPWESLSARARTLRVFRMQDKIDRQLKQAKADARVVSSFASERHAKPVLTPFLQAAEKAGVVVRLDTTTSLLVPESSDSFETPAIEATSLPAAPKTAPDDSASPISSTSASETPVESSLPSLIQSTPSSPAPASSLSPEASAPTPPPTADEVKPRKMTKNIRKREKAKLTVLEYAKEEYLSLIHI